VCGRCCRTPTSGRFFSALSSACLLTHHRFPFVSFVPDRIFFISSRHHHLKSTFDHFIPKRGRDSLHSSARQVSPTQFLFGLASSLTLSDTLARFTAATDTALRTLAAGPAAAAELSDSVSKLVRASGKIPPAVATFLHEIREQTEWEWSTGRSEKRGYLAV
jgi:hypothetical protein